MRSGRTAVSDKAVVLVIEGVQDGPDETAELLSQEFDVITARGVKEALEILLCNEVEVVCADFNIPGINGVQLLRWMRTAYPNVKPLLITALREAALHEMRSSDFIPLLVKPYSAEILLKTVRRAVQSARLKRFIEFATAERAAARRGDVTRFTEF